MLPELRTDLFGRNENRKFYTVSGACKECGEGQGLRAVIGLVVYPAICCM
jgi:hypothetical protein